VIRKVYGAFAIAISDKNFELAARFKAIEI